MGFIFNKRVKVTPDTSVNVSKSGVSASKKVGRVTVNSRGSARVSIVPGLGFKIGGKKKK